MRKMTEIIFHGTNIHIKIVPTGGTKRERKPNKEKETVVVREENNSYANMVRKLKEGMTLKTMQENIGKVRKTRKGEMIITIEKDVEKVKKEIKTVLKDSKIESTKGGMKILYVKNLDVTMEKEGLKTALLEACGSREQDLEMIGEIREAASGTRSATVRVNKHMANELTQRKYIKLGLGYSTIEERIEVKRCFRCWEHDHLAKDCKGTDRSGLCQKCGKQGHKVKECNEEEEYCPLCQEKGHRARKTRCEKFREALKKARDAEKKDPSRHKQENEDTTRKMEKEKDPSHPTNHDGAKNKTN